mmetsp:Transcript_16476/g.19012  ORF Transcript_16476/g.19012 Transcript_16476/m.19012 type:complete len:109 (-) Transcript_16476:757-1083(-)
MGFNEHIGGRQFSSQYDSSEIGKFNMGMPDENLFERPGVWVDTYGDEFSRDIELTVEGGRIIFDIIKSCVQLYKVGVTCENVLEETNLCCSTKDTEIWNNVWSVQERR